MKLGLTVLSLGIFSFNFYSRKKGLYTRDKSKLFLKQSCENTDGVWRVKVGIGRVGVVII